MTGHVRKRGDRWECVVELGDQPAQTCPACRNGAGRRPRFWASDGQLKACPKCGGELEDVVARHQIVLPARHQTKKLAEKALRDALHEREHGDYVEPVDLTVADYLQKRWLPSLGAEELSGNTLRAYRMHVELRIVPHIGRVPLQKLTRNDVALLSARLASEKSPRKPVLSPASRRSVLVCLHRALNDAVASGLIRTNPSTGVKRPTIRRREMSTWSAKDLHAFLQATEGDRLHPLWRLLSQTGLRRGEALGLRWSDVDLDAGKLSVQRQRTTVGYRVEEGPTKSGRGRSVPIDAGTVTALRQQSQQQLDDAAKWIAWADDGHVFTREDGAPWQPDRVTKRFGEAVAAVDVPRIRLHDLRHTWATLALRAGVHPKVVQERLGHSTISITMDVYSHALPDMQESAAELVAALVDGAQDAS
jgi:integrase